jgi:hypothetical protein
MIPHLIEQSVFDSMLTSFCENSFKREGNFVEKRRIWWTNRAKQGMRRNETTLYCNRTSTMMMLLPPVVIIILVRLATVQMRIASRIFNGYRSSQSINERTLVEWNYHENVVESMWCFFSLLTLVRRFAVQVKQISWRSISNVSSEPTSFSQFLLITDASVNKLCKYMRSALKSIQ